jgi:DNA-binding SARP family transcriptional activator
MASIEGTEFVSLRCFLLGKFDATAGDEPLPPPPYRVQGLLAALLLRPGTYQRAHLTGLLLPDIPERKGRQRLSHLLWQLRRWCPALPLETTPQTVQLLPDGLWLDVDAFRRLVSDRDLKSWLEALALYRGDLLEGIYDDWLLGEREALYLRYVDVAHRACDALWQQRRFEELLPVVERLVQREPYDECALRTLMRAYRALGRRGAALAAYERYVSMALDELEIEPDPATQALARAVRTAPSAPTDALLPIEEAGSTCGLLHGAQEALVRGEVEQVRAVIRNPRVRSAAPAAALHLLEIDLALFLEDYKRAAFLLSREHPPDPHAAARVQLRSARLALGRHDVSRAEALALEVLVAAREFEDSEMELGALLVLVDLHHHLGQGTHAARSAERALHLAREQGLHYGVARVLVLQGINHLYQGRYERARACLYEARSVAWEHGLRYDLAAALRGLRILCTYNQAFLEALEIARQEISIWRDLGLERWEAVALEGISLIQSYLGRSEESLRTLTQAQEISRRLDDPVRLAITYYNLASTMLYHDDGLASEAADLAQQALEQFRTYKEHGWEAATLIVLGYGLWIGGGYAAALDHLRQAHALCERQGELAFVPEVLAYQGLAHLGLEQPTEAMALTRRAVTSMAQGDVSGEVIPEICYAHAMALAANGQEEQARDYLKGAYECLLEGAAALQDEEARQAFFHRNPTTRRLMKELLARGIAPPPDADVRSVSLPAARSGAPLRVRWTVDAGPADVALRHAQGAIALRRARLERLLEEAQSQGAAPSSADLAQALGVSRRTVQRDLAALRHTE